MADADIELLPLVEWNVGLYRLSLIIFSGLCSLIGFLRGSELVELLLYGLILYLLEEQMRLTQLMTGLKQVGATQFSPVKLLHANHLAQVLAREGQERLKGDGEVGHELQRDVEDGLHTLRVGLPHLPRLAFGDVFIADAREVHGLLLCLTELEVIQVLLHLFLHILELGDGLLIDVEQFATGGHHAVPVFLREL